MIILGAGLSGLLCGVLNPLSRVYEANRFQPHYHRSLLRLKTPEIGRLTGIPLRKVTVHKSLWFQGDERPVSVRLAHLYSRKVSGLVTARSILNLESEIRYIPPDDFIQQLRDRTTEINYGKRVTKITPDTLEFDNGTTVSRCGDPIISTIPMKALHSLTIGKEPNINFPSKAITVNRIKIKNADSYCTIYYPDPDMTVYRATMNGDTLIMESGKDVLIEEFQKVLDSFGISQSMVVSDISNYSQSFGKISPIEDGWRKNFILCSTLGFNVYSLGRFATWRPKVVQDDVLEDIFHIRRMINEGPYEANKHPQEVS